MTFRSNRPIWRIALTCYAVSLLVVISGLTAGLLTSKATDRRSPDRAAQSGNRFRDTLAQWDGQWYQKIAVEGYSYDPARMSAVAFFPLYPMLGRAVAAVTHVPIDIALLIVSHAFLLGGLMLLARYAEEDDDVRDAAVARAASESSRSPSSQNSRGLLAVWALVLFPTSFFMVVAYSESLCLTLTLLTMWGIKRQWPLGKLALLVGLATAARPVGVALWPPLAWYVWRSSASRQAAVLRIVASSPLALSGLALYILFQYVAFDAPLAFIQSQDHWRYRPRLPLGEKLLVLFSWEPLWAVYVPGWPTYWASPASSPCIFASLQAANPVLFAGGVIAIVAGWAKRWLSGPEILLAAGMLGIPYVTRAYEMNMASHGRFLLPVFPIFLVIGRILQRSPVPLAIAYFAASATFLFIYSWMWAKGYVLI